MGLNATRPQGLSVDGLPLLFSEESIQHWPQIDEHDLQENVTAAIIEIQNGRERYTVESSLTTNPLHLQTKLVCIYK